MANKLIQQPDILSLDTLGSFMDAQNDPIATVIDKEENEVTKVEETSSEVNDEEIVQSEVTDTGQKEVIPQRPKSQRNGEANRVRSLSSRLALVSGI